MPQMSPLNWIFLFIFFSSLFMLFSIMNYFTPTYKPSPSKYNKMYIYPWKW
uniref:ATP synthase complex subunit 8 n=1 Tax=Curculionidae sp. BMNH 1040049 TaxID=1903777 RepID=A0A343A5W6_9CUCU|nr:ATP synthase F0 subunit 8 [Curculionidae sp. BMNH 1040049]